MTDQYLKEAMARSRQQDNERKIAAAELRRLAQAARHAETSSEPWQRAIAARMSRLPVRGLVAGAWRSLGHGLVAVVGRRAPA